MNERIGRIITIMLDMQIFNNNINCMKSLISLPSTQDNLILVFVAIGRRLMYDEVTAAAVLFIPLIPPLLQ